MLQLPKSHESQTGPVQPGGLCARAAVVRYFATLGTVAAVILIAQRLPLERPLGGLITLGVMVLCAWIGGLGPALLMCPLVLAMSRMADDKSWNLTLQEVVAFAVITSITSAVGLAGQYRRRIRLVTGQHALKLRDQARALSLAHIVFCDVMGRVTEWTEGAEKMFGWTSAEAVDRDLHELLRTRFPVSLEDIHQELFTGGQWEGEVVHHHKQGAELIIATHWILYRNERGDPVGIAKIHNDVSDLRRAEAVVREADRRKDEFLAMLAHELRNPLAPIRMGLELMKFSANRPEIMEEIRLTMERQTLQLVALVDDLLDVSRITRGKLELRKQRVKLAEVLHSALEASRPLINQGGHVLSVAAVDPKIHLNADPHRLAQVFSNLLNNAAKYTSQGGGIEFKSERQGSDVLVSVKDSGIGIPEDMRERIFEMFAQIKSPEGESHPGLGIGLTLVKSLVEMHDGRIEVQSAGPMKGSEFIVRLPILAETAEIGRMPIPAPQNATTEHRRRVLVVDDNLAAVKMLSMIVNTLGNDVRTAHDGEEAIQVAADFLPDLIIMDLGMPKMNGYEAARHIRQQSWGKGMLLVALSGWGQEDDKRKTKEAGFDHHLTKPAEPSEIRKLLVNRPRQLN